jgi:hypothetical protein
MQKIEIIGYAMGCAMLLSTSHATYGMMSTIRSKFSAANLAIRSHPQRLSARYYNLYRTPASQRSLQQQQKPVTSSVVPQIQLRAFHASPTPQFSASISSPMSVFRNFTRWAMGKPTAEVMFKNVEQYLQDGSGYGELLRQIESGNYNDIINTEKQWNLYTGSSSDRTTIFDMLLSQLMRFDRFGTNTGLYFSKNTDGPLPTYADFYDSQMTPQLVVLIKALAKQGAGTAHVIPVHLIEGIAEFYGFLEKVVTPPPALKQQFLEYLKDIKNTAYLIYEKTDKAEAFMASYMAGRSFEEFFAGTANDVYVPYSLKEKLQQAANSGYTKQKNSSPEPSREEPERSEDRQEKSLAIDTMFNAARRFLQDGSGYAALLKQVENGSYNGIVNEKKQWNLYAGGSSDDVTIVDILLSRLMRFDKFGKYMYKYFEENPNMPLPTYADFFDPRLTPELVRLIKALIKQGADTAYIIPIRLLEKLAESYGFIRKVVALPQESVRKEQFLGYLKDIKEITHLLYERTDKSDASMIKKMKGRSFEQFFEKEAEDAHIPREVRDKLTNRRLQTIVEQMLAGEYAKVLTMINNGSIDDIIDETLITDYFFGGPCEEFEKKEGLTLLEVLLQQLLKTKTVRSPIELKTKKWLDLFNPEVDLKWIPVIRALAQKTIIRNDAFGLGLTFPIKTIQSLIAYVVVVEAFVAAPTYSYTAYQEYIQAIKDITEDIFVQMKKTSRVEAMLPISFSYYVDMAKKKYNVVSNYEWGQSSRTGERARQQRRPPSQEERTEALKILGFAANESPTKDEIVRKYKELIAQYHPDVLKGKSDKEKKEILVRAQRINAARDALVPK